MDSRWFYAGISALCITATMAQAEQILSVEDAAEQVASGEMILLDIRSEAEWDETGVATSALPVSMHTSDFGKTLSEVIQTAGKRQIGLICATGGRSSYVMSILEKNGITQISDISEGMMGNNRGAGWIAKGMPVERPKAALERLDAFLSE